MISKRVLDILEWPAVRDALAGMCATEPGRARVRALEPLPPEAGAEQIRAITDLKELMGLGEAPDFSGTSDIAPQARLAEKGGTLKLEELAAIREFIRASQRLQKFLKTNAEDSKPLQALCYRLDPLVRIGDLLGRSLTDTGELSESEYPTLKSLRREIHNLRQEIQKKMSRMTNSPALEQALQEKVFTTRNDRYVILVKSGMKGRVNGTIHDISASGSTLFIEPEEIIPLNNRALQLERELQSEIFRIMQILSAQVGDHAGELVANLGVIAQLDLVYGAARFSRAVRCNEPELADGPVLELVNARHPLLMLQSAEGVVGNDVSLGKQARCLIISGANTGGKTVLLKTVGLCALFVSFGLHIPASPDSRVGVFTTILADIGDDQDIAESLSSFSGQIVAIDQMLRQADAGTLVLIDEIIVGTNPRQGAALAQAILETLVTTGSCIVVTTHYPELKELPSRDSRFANASVAFNLDTLQPTYELRHGIPGVSYAFEIARNYGVPEEVVARARALQDERDLSVEALIEEMQRRRQEVEEEKTALAALRAELEERGREYDEKERKLLRQREELKQKQGTRLYEELENARDRIAERISGLQGMNLQEAGELQERIIGMLAGRARDLARDRADLHGDSYRAFDPGETRPGGRVFIVPLQLEGRIEALDLDRESADILFGSSFRGTYPFRDLLIPTGSAPQAKTEARARKRTAAERAAEEVTPVPLTIQTSYNTVDLRGMRVDEALTTLEGRLDAMTRSGISTAVVIHGHGTGALKEAVRRELAHSYNAAEFRRGEQGEGGDGVTIVLLRR